MESSKNYPSSLYLPPTCTFQDFCNGLSFTNFSSFYQQLNPRNPPGLQYVQQHWIVLINELFPDIPHEGTQSPIVNAIGQELKFQAFAANNVGVHVNVGHRPGKVAKHKHSMRWYKGGTWIDKDAGSPKAKTETSAFDGNTYHTERERFDLERKRSGVAEDSHSDENRLFTGLTTSEALLEAGMACSDLPITSPDPSHFRGRYRGKRADKQTKLSNSVANSAIAGDAAVEEQDMRTGEIARALTGNIRQGSDIATEGHSLGSNTRDQSDVVHFSFALDPEHVDPCSLSQSELDAAITELLRSVQYEMDAIHADRLKILKRAGRTRASATA